MADISNVRDQLTGLFKNGNVHVATNRRGLFEKFSNDPENIAAMNLIKETENQIMAKWKIQDRIAGISGQNIRILNASVGKSYEARFDFEQLGWSDISAFEFDGLQQAGLAYDDSRKLITGNPTQSGDIKITFRYRLAEQSESDPFNEKAITLIINPDPKSLWKNIESDKSDPHWKENDVTVFAPLGDKHILVSSKRGRAHSNAGSFREDDFAFKNLSNGWSIVVVSDGAGSAKLSRKGSQLACNGIVDFFSEEFSGVRLAEFDQLLEQHNTKADEGTHNKLNLFVYNNLGKAVFTIHKNMEAFAAAEGIVLKDLSSTLIFVLLKKYTSGYAFLSFGVGDCPMAFLNEDMSEVTQLNWIDVGEFGGGTRFITMPEIFQSDKFATRFGFKQAEDFSYLFLMSDGIYDPKFVVEASLPDVKKWQGFLKDLGGNNEDRIKVDLSADNTEIESQFSKWMDFWSPGNHDDRTLAIVF